MHCGGWNIQIPYYLSLRNIVFKHLNYLLTHLLANCRSSAHLCSYRTRPFLDAAFVPNHDNNDLLTSLVSNHIIIKLFYLITTPKLPSSQLFLESVAGLNGRNGCIFTNQMKLTRQNMKYLVFILSAMKYKSRYIYKSLLSFFIFIFHTVPTVSDLGLYMSAGNRVA